MTKEKMEHKENMALWNDLRTVPEDAQKTISGGRLKGFTDIKPQWRYQRLTEIFGPCGIGWLLEIDKLWIEVGPDDQRAAFAQVSLSVKHEGEWSKPVPGVGGSMFVAQEREGLHTSDEAYKMAITDAIGTAAKLVGLAADVYMGHSGSKYDGDRPGGEPQGGPPQGQKKDYVPTAKDFEHLAELREKLLALAGKDPGVAQSLLIDYSKFTTSDGKEMFVDSLRDPAAPQDKNKWNPRLLRNECKWLNTILGRAREEYDNMQAVEPGGDQGEVSW